MNIRDSVIKKLIHTHTTISTMESCTSGMIASMITDTEGASAIFPGGYVTYLNETKVLVGVDSDIISRFGVYSGKCAEAMAKTAMKNLNTDIGIGITGTTGNLDPNNADSIQGKAFFCIAIHGDTHIFEISADVTDMNRHAIKKKYADKVFEKLSELI